MEFESVDVANHVLSLENHFLNNKKVTVENHKNSYNNTLKLCNMEGGKGQKKGLNFPAWGREGSQSNESETWNQLDWHEAEENHSVHAKNNHRTKHTSTEAKRAESGRTNKHQLMVEEDDFDHDYSESRQNEEAEEEEDDDDFNLGLLVPKSFDHEPQDWEQSPTNHAIPRGFGTELDHQGSEFDAQQSAPLWKKQSKPCVAESQSSITRKQEIPLMHHSNAVEGRSGPKKNQKQQVDPVLPSANLRKGESGRPVPQRSEPCAQNSMNVERAPSLLQGCAEPGFSKLRVMQPNNGSNLLTHRALIVAQCQEYASLETFAHKSKKLPTNGPRPRSDSNKSGARGISAGKGEGRPFLFCAGLIDERVSNYRFNTQRRRVGRFF